MVLNQLIFITIFYLSTIYANTSYPYLSGYTWLSFCDWRFIGDDYVGKREVFDPELVNEGDTIFIDSMILDEFISDYLPKIQYRVILVSANYGFGSDHSLPGRFNYLLEDEKIAAWFVQNIDREPSDKLIPIPIGLASSNWAHGDTKMLDSLIPISLNKPRRKNFIYLNITPRPERKKCIEHFTKLGTKFESPKPFKHYLKDLSKSIFVISPPGNGVDCHRTWEALLMGCYPVVESSTLNPLYQDLPIVIINNWEEVTEEFLHQKYLELSSKDWPRESLYAPYWFKRVRTLQNKLKQEKLDAT